MASKFYDNWGGFKVWRRPLKNGSRFEVRHGNRVLYTSQDLLSAQQHAKDRNNAFWDEQARVRVEWFKQQARSSGTAA